MCFGAFNNPVLFLDALIHTHSHIHTHTKSNKVKREKSRLIDTYIFPSNLFFAPVNLETVIKSSVFESSECLILKEQVFKKEEKKMALGAG